MTSPSHDHLLGFLVGALEPCEHEQLEREIAANPELTAQLETIASRLQPLEAARAAHASPPGLAARTCGYVFENSSAEPLATPARRGLAAAMSPDYAGVGHYSRWSMADFVVAAGIFLAAGMLFFPAIASSRYYAHMAQCQMNLRQFGFAYNDYSDRHPNDNPLINQTAHRNRAVAGVTFATLREAGHFPEDFRMVCKGSPDAQRFAERDWPTSAELDRAEGSVLRELQRMIGGTYAYTLGFISGGRHCCERGQCNSQQFAIAADAPHGTDASLHHDGEGQNVLFYNGSIRYVKGPGLGRDKLYLNNLDEVAPGEGPNDNVLGVSGTPFYPRGLIRMDH